MINDHYGYVIGDEVLVRTAEALRQSVRSTNTLTRYGGEEFMTYLPHTEHDLAVDIVVRVRQAVKSIRMAVNYMNRGHRDYH